MWIGPERKRTYVRFDGRGELLLLLLERLLAEVHLVLQLVLLDSSQLLLESGVINKMASFSFVSTRDCLWALRPHSHWMRGAKKWSQVAF